MSPVPPQVELRVEQLPERRCAIRRHDGGLDTIDETRRPLYQYMIMNELVGGPSVLRFTGDPKGDSQIEVLVGATGDFDGDDELTVEILPKGNYAVADFEGPTEDLDGFRHDFAAAVGQSHGRTGPILQLHLMDEVDGETEQQLQIWLND